MCIQGRSSHYTQYSHAVFVSTKKKIVSCALPLTKASLVKPNSHMYVHTRAWTTIKVQSSNLEHMLAVESREWLSTVSLVVFPRLVKYPTNLSVISFQDASLASLKLSVAFFKDHCLSYFFMHVSVSNLHFPQMKLASEKPPEPVLKGAKFSWWSMPPDPPRLWRALHTIPHPLWKFGQTWFFLLPMALV